MTRERGGDTDEEAEICQSVGDEQQEMLLSKNMPFLKGKQSLEGVRSPHGEEKQNSETHWEASGTTEKPITHPLPVELAISKTLGG